MNAESPRVKEIGLRTSRVESREGVILIIPNHKLVSEKLINWSTNHHVNRFVVTLVEKDERHPWFGKGLVGRGHEIAFAIDSVPGKELTLVRGRTYEFEIRSTPAHDFYLSSSPFGRGREVLVNGVEGNYTHKGIVTFRPIASTPNIIYYQCQNHTYMGGVIYIVDRPGQTPQRIAWEDESGEVINEPEKDPETLIKAVKNKIAFAMLSIRSSSAAKRIAESDHAEAQSMLHRADGLISEAQSRSVL